MKHLIGGIIAGLLVCWAALPDAWSATIHVPADRPTIQAGIAAAARGDTVLVACGVYPEHDIQMASGVVLRSATGAPDCATIDAQWLGRVLACVDADSTTRIEGFTITRGTLPGCSTGAGLYCSNASPRIVDCTFIDNDECGGAGMHCAYSSPRLTRCTFRDNNAEYNGGGIYCDNSSLDLVDCTFADNRAEDGGGAIDCVASSPTLVGCTFTGNRAGRGGALSCTGASTPTITSCAFVANSGYFRGGAIELRIASVATVESCVFWNNSAYRDGGAVACVSANAYLTQSTLWANAAGLSGAGVHLDDAALAQVERSIIAGAPEGEAVACGDPNCGAVLACCDVWGNAGGDWVACIAEQAGQSGNLGADPRFCDAANGDFTLEESSPCAAEHAPPGCGLIGALDVGCAATGIPCDEGLVFDPTGRGASDGGAGVHARILPNPLAAAGVAWLRWDGGAAGNLLVKLYDAQGRLRGTATVSLDGRTGPYDIPWHAIAGHDPLAAGVYYLECTYRNDRAGLADRTEPAGRADRGVRADGADRPATAREPHREVVRAVILR